MSSIQLSKENNAMYRIYYHCSECGEEWTDEWSCTCNDRCPKCNAETPPYSSEEIDAVINAKGSTLSRILNDCVCWIARLKSLFHKEAV